MENTLSFFLTDHTISVGRFRLNSHGRAVFILCCQLSFSLIGMVNHLLDYEQSPIFPQGQQSARNARAPAPRRVSPFLAWGDFHARSRFARSSIPEETQGTIRSLIIYIYSRKLKRFFLRRQDTPYQPEYSQVTNLAASGVTSPLVGLKRIVGVVQDSNSRHDQLEYFQTTFGKCTSSSLR